MSVDDTERVGGPAESDGRSEHVSEAAGSEPRNPQHASLKSLKPPDWWPEPTVLTMQDLADLPRQILPEQTYTHLRNAGREAALALFSLYKAVEDSRRRSTPSKPRKRIEVE